MWRARLTALLLLAGILLPAAPRILAQHEPTADDVAEGERLFTSTCTGCHGAEGDAVFGVDLGRGQFRNSTTDDDLVRTIRNGLTGTAMPPSTFTDEQARNLVAYLRSRVSTPLSMVPGDPGRGKALFEGKGKCVTCHRVEGNGSRFGPDLSDIGQLRKVPELERSLVEPGAEIVPANRMLRVVTRDGAVTTGRLLNHDTFAVLLIDAQERLRSFAKASLREYRFVDTSEPSELVLHLRPGPGDWIGSRRASARAQHRPRDRLGLLGDLPRPDDLALQDPLASFHCMSTRSVPSPSSTCRT